MAQVFQTRYVEHGIDNTRVIGERRQIQTVIMIRFVGSCVVVLCAILQHDGLVTASTHAIAGKTSPPVRYENSESFDVDQLRKYSEHEGFLLEHRLQQARQVAKEALSVFTPEGSTSRAQEDENEPEVDTSYLEVEEKLVSEIERIEREAEAALSCTSAEFNSAATCPANSTFTCAWNRNPDPAITGCREEIECADASNGNSGMCLGNRNGCYCSNGNYTAFTAGFQATAADQGVQDCVDEQGAVQCTEAVTSTGILVCNLISDETVCNSISFPTKNYGEKGCQYVGSNCQPHAEANAAAHAVDAATTTTAGGSNTMLIIGVVVTLLAIGGGVGGYFYFNKNSATPAPAEEDEAAYG